MACVGQRSTGLQENPVSQQSIKIGEILIEQGVLSEQQVFEVLEAQKEHRMPFGVLAERMFDVTLHSIETAWVEQYHRFTGTIDLSHEKFDNEALRALNRRQAWQFELLPIRTEPNGEMLMAASANRLARAVTFAANRIDRAVYFRIAEQAQLREFLQMHYPMPELSREIIQKAHDLAASA
jgi:type II secretion system (T2SS) protein E